MNLTSAPAPYKTGNNNQNVKWLKPVSDFNINGDIFHHWAENLLLPKLPPNSIIVMDNARFHIREDIKNLIEQAGHTILWLPAYSPDLNPIEHTWAWLKRLRQDWCLDNIDLLFFYFI